MSRLTFSLSLSWVNKNQRSRRRAALKTKMRGAKLRDFVRWTDGC